MIIYFKKYKIFSDKDGYTIAKRRGNTWRNTWYFNTLPQAINGLFDHIVMTETDDCILDLNDVMNFPSQKTALIKKIEEIKSGLMKGLQDGQ